MLEILLLQNFRSLKARPCHLRQIALRLSARFAGGARVSNIAGKAYAINVLTPMRPWRTWIQNALFMLARVLPAQLSGLLGLKLIHFARWVIIRRKQWPDPTGKSKQTLDNDYMLFLSNFNGTWDQYIDAFSDGIPSGLDLFWYASTKYPHSLPTTTFKDYIGTNQIQTNYYYNATPGAAQRDIKAALRVRRELLALADIYRGSNPGAFAQAYRAALNRVANSLASPGYAPVASIATKKADVARRQFISMLDAKHEGSHA
jgi:hypothetical protein